MSLVKYKDKRNFKNTPEPSGKKKSKPGSHTFVVQRHDASHLHYDFRLEVNGVLKSWAVPKGPSMNPADKRLAVMVEDHPLPYAKFEGKIPAGNYGAGSVLLWDHGRYEPLEAGHDDTLIEKNLSKGSFKFFLHGEKLKGSFSLVQMKDGKQKNWLLIKHKDEYAIQVPFDIEAVSTPGKTVSGTPAKTSRNFTSQRSVRSGNDKLTTFIKPMLAQIHEKPFDDPDWIYEVKWDGYRAVAEISREEIKLYSRNGLSFLRLYPKVAEELKKLKEDVILDGEIVVLNENNKPDFQKLQQFDDHPSLPIIYYIFDCLSYNGKSIALLPLLERKKIAAKVLVKSNIIKYSDHVIQSGVEFFSKIIQMDLEGMIAKRGSSLYFPGKRSRDWLKIKNHNTQEAVIAGYTAPRGSRKYFGALILGIYMNKKLKYIGHTGTGFTASLLKEVFEVIKPLKRETSPFDKKVAVNAPVTWVEPVTVCAIKFTEITEEGILRHPVFLGLRIDKSAEETTTLDAKVKMKKQKKPNPAPDKRTSKPVGKQEEKIKVDGHVVTLSNQNKIYWPDEKITKGDVIQYYNTISKYILPYLKNRPQSLKRNPNGILDNGFFHKDAGHDAPAWVDTVSIRSESSNKNIEYILCNGKATLLYLNNLGCIELNPWNSRVANLDYPDYLAIDLDPADNNTFEQVIDAALVVKQVLDQSGATAYCKTSGATGLHIYVPLKTQYSYEEIQPFASQVANMIHQMLPATTTLERALNKRKGRIYIDYLQNKKGQTLASVYSIRPKPGAPISTPLLWKEVKRGLHPSQFNIRNIGKRLSKTGDLFTGVLHDKINLKKCLKNLGA